MFSRIAAIAFIFVCTSVAWFVLGGTINYRTTNSNDRLRPGVSSIWGSPQDQGPPVASHDQDDRLHRHAICCYENDRRHSVGRKIRPPQSLTWWRVANQRGDFYGLTAQWPWKTSLPYAPCTLAFDDAYRTLVSSVAMN
jgi:hypothetical protein